MSGAPKQVRIPAKRPAFMSENKKTGKTAKSNKFLNFMEGAKKSFGGGILDPYFKVGGGKVRPKVKKGYFGITFEKKF
tara:strand:+ start:990 stop:1223 length:234 start_codon:yes stop_codon:yes gene_type:complete